PGLDPRIARKLPTQALQLEAGRREPLRRCLQPYADLACRESPALQVLANVVHDLGARRALLLHLTQIGLDRLDLAPCRGELFFYVHALREQPLELLLALLKGADTGFELPYQFLLAGRESRHLFLESLHAQARGIQARAPRLDPDGNLLGRGAIRTRSFPCFQENAGEALSLALVFLAAAVEAAHQLG